MRFQPLSSMLLSLLTIISGRELLSMADAPAYAPHRPLHPRSPAHTLFPPMTPSEAFAQTLAVVAQAWPNTSTAATPLECAAQPSLPGCIFDWGLLSPIRCASATIYAQTVGWADPSPFARLFPNAAEDAEAVAALAEGATYTVDYTEATNVLTGANIWLLNWFNLTLPLEVPIWIDIVRPPNALWAHGSVSSMVLDSYVLDTLGYDCVVDGTTETTDGALYKTFGYPHQTSARQVLASQPSVVKDTFIRTLFTWTKPFSATVWACIMASFALSGALMSYFEMGVGGSKKEWELGSMGPLDGSKPRFWHFLLHGFYQTLVAFITSNNSTFKTTTVPGRINNVALSFAILLIVSCYVANLAALLGNPPHQGAVVAQLSDFSANAVRACFLNTSDDARFLASLSGRVRQGLSPLVLNSSRMSDLVQAIAPSDGSPPLCAGSVVDTAMASFALGPDGDAGGASCELVLTGPLVTHGLYAIAFSSRLSAPVIAALDALISYAVLTGSYESVVVDANTFGGIRSQCAANSLNVAPGSTSLTLSAFAGIFFVMGAGSLTALLFKVTGSLYNTKHIGIERMMTSVIDRMSPHSPRAELTSGAEEGDGPETCGGPGCFVGLTTQTPPPSNRLYVS